MMSSLSNDTHLDFFSSMKYNVKSKKQSHWDLKKEREREKRKDDLHCLNETLDLFI